MGMVFTVIPIAVILIGVFSLALFGYFVKAPPILQY